MSDNPKRPHPNRADIDNGKDRVWTTDDRDGFIINKNKMRKQFDWSGPSLIDKKLLVSPKNLDKPQEQLRSLVLPPDPDPLFNARPEPYTMDETDWRVTQDDDIRITQDDDLRVTQPSQYEAVSEGTG